MRRGKLAVVIARQMSECLRSRRREGLFSFAYMRVKMSTELNPFITIYFFLAFFISTLSMVNAFFCFSQVYLNNLFEVYVYVKFSIVF